MKLLRWVCSFACLASLIAATGSAQAASAPFCQPGQVPTYQFGFAALHDQLGDGMGEPLECEHPNPQNGDTLQRTAGGLAYWRKATNTPTFTDGYDHWAITAAGLVAWVGASADPPPIGAASTPTAPGCVPVPGSTCLRIDASDADLVGLLGRTSVGPGLLRSAASSGVTVVRGAAPPDTWADFNPNTRTVLLGNQLAAFSPAERAAVLAHELQHASDWVELGAILTTPNGCYSSEANAFETESDVWVELNDGVLPPAKDDLARELDAVASAIAEDPQNFLQQLVIIYQPECLPR